MLPSPESIGLVQVSLVLLLGAMSPGPSLAVVIRRTLGDGRAAGIACSIGHGIGVGLLALLAISSIGIALIAMPTAIEIIRIIGSFFLIFLGMISLQAKQDNEHTFPHEGIIDRGPFLEGMAVAWTNPKIIVFFTALFAPLIGADTTWNNRILFSTVACFIDAGWYVIVASILTGTTAFELLKRHEKTLSRMLGVVLITFGIWISITTIF